MSILIILIPLLLHSVDSYCLSQKYKAKSLHSSVSISGINKVAFTQFVDELPSADITGPNTLHPVVKVIFKSFATAAKEIKDTISLSTFTVVEDAKTSSSTGNINSSGDNQKSIDIIANDIIKLQLSNDLASVNINAYIVSEEEEIPIKFKSSSCSDTFVIAFDPLDGSSNLDCAIPTGTIFGIYEVNGESFEDTGKIDLRQMKGRHHIVASGYIMYSSSTEMVISCLKQSNGFTYDYRDDDWYLTRKSIQMPSRGFYYSLNEARYSDWPKGLQTYIENLKSGQNESKKRYSSRYVCSLVADFHRTLLYGGWAGNPRKHLRLLYEAAPLALIAENAGGLGSDGIVNILDIAPDSSVHHRLPVFLGSTLDILELMTYKDVQQLSTPKYDA